MELRARSLWHTDCTGLISSAMMDSALATREQDVTGRLWAIVPAGQARRWGFRLPSRRLGPLAPLRAALDRAADLIPPHRRLAVLARGHAHDGGGLGGARCVTQPAYRGSAAEIFLPLSMIARWDPAAIALILPAHGVGQDEAEFLETVERAARSVAAKADLLVVLGLAPPCPRAPGWIEPGGVVPGLERFGVHAVRRFVRRPAFGETATLQARGGLVNTGTVVALAETLLALGRRRLPDVLETLEPLAASAGGPEERLLCEAIYEGMPYADLSHALFAAGEPFGALPIPRARARVRPAASA
jgi:hypothetical protein